ncbi:hypothetical protein DSO57_1033238 [Entomophthora muscae]|uniref:Uncharacterized protein n=1 Tax=Entomophthora muscae TaxID=34485 RepID=A0ACC2S207_9FUNG|nr:hypothetical protein DSO57_1033238 [Entomophthora muscae]
MSANINLEYTRGILPVSLEHGHIPTAKAIEMCRRRQNEEDVHHKADLLLAELAAQDFSGESIVYLADSENDEETLPQAPAATKPKTSRGPFQLIKKSLFRTKNKTKIKS